MAVRTGERSPFALSESDRERLSARIELALRRARRSGRATLATMACPLPVTVDPVAVVCASRRAGEPWFAFEQPDRAGSALAALGEVLRLEEHGPARFARVADRWRTLSAAAVADSPGDPDGGGPLLLGGFAFAPDGGSSPLWRGFAPASMLVPELALTRDGSGTSNRGGGGNGEGGSEHAQVRMTLATLAAPDDTEEDLLRRLCTRVNELSNAPLPLLDPAPTGRYQVSSGMPPEHYEAAVARAAERIRKGQIQKIVIARDVEVHAPSDYDPGALFGVLRDAFSSCFVFCVGRGDSTLIAASPELLVRREGQRISTIALAGSTRRSADPAVDAHLGERLLRDPSYREEHAIVVRRIERTLNRHAIWVAASPEPTLVRIANIQHLATPIRAQLAAPIEAIELAGMMHPTPAVGGEPADAALELIPALEGLDRGWYTGPVGWSDAAGDGEFCVALRCALLRGNVARCYAGNGIVRDSVPHTELGETEIKLAALLPLLSS
ncbi:MAG TPA: isochorismate synthase [Solirubrobacteraceae bacterium]|nr:isochorismate synthase [Solirubrobacteraceae bacterium]